MTIPENLQAQNGRSFDFNAYKKRHVLLHVSYAGWDLHGFAVQEITGKTVESELFKALTRTKLIEARETSNYHRCGRTDKGVSAFHQVQSSSGTLIHSKVDVSFFDILEGHSIAIDVVVQFEFCRKKIPAV